MKRNIILLMVGFTALLFVISCVNSDYDFDNINKEAVFSNENGLYLTIGDFDTIWLKQNMEINTLVDLSITEDVKGLFSESLYNSLVMTGNGKDEAIGPLSFVGDFISHISYAVFCLFSDIILSVEVLKKNGDNTGIVIDDQVFKSATTVAQPFLLTISKDNVLKMKDASILRFIYKFSARKINEDGYLLGQHVKIKFASGIKFDLE